MWKKRLSDRVADDILNMITIEKKFKPGDKLPNELDLAVLLDVSRTTLREAIRILATNGVVEIQRGKGTFINKNLLQTNDKDLKTLQTIKTDMKDLYEMRLIFEPEAAYLATLRGSEEEIKRILMLGKEINTKIKDKENRTQSERAFHKAIAKATHNDFMNKLMPVIYQAIDKGVKLSEEKQKALSDTVQDHNMIMDFMEKRNAEGARNAMKIHILHAMQELDIDTD